MRLAPSRFPMASLWLLTLVPGNALVLLDLQRGVVRPGTWAVRLAPALLLLAVVGWARLHASPAAVRLRRELRLSLGSGLVLAVTSGAALCLDAVPEGAAHELLRTLPWVLALVYPAAVVLMPMTLERERGTLAQVLVSPLGARAFTEKFALAAGLVVLSWLQLSVGEQRGTELWWFALAGHVLALATVPTWFFLTQDDETSLGFVVLTPFFALAPAGLVGPAAVVPCAALYGVVMLALLPAAIRRGVASGAPAWLRRDAPGLTWLERRARPMLRAELRGQRDAIILGLGSLFTFGVFQAMGERDVAPMALFVFSAVAAVLSPVLAFTEAQRLGTLDAQLIVQPRLQVFGRRALVSALTTALLCVLAPLLLLATTPRFSAGDVAGWLLGMTVLWTVGLAAAVHFGSTGSALAAGLGLSFGLVLAHGALLLLSAVGTTVLLGSELFPHPGAFLAAALAIVAVVAVAVAWRRFVRADRLEPRVMISAGAVSLGHAAVLGAACAVAAVLGLG